MTKSQDVKTQSKGRVISFSDFPMTPPSFAARKLCRRRKRRRRREGEIKVSLTMPRPPTSTTRSSRAFNAMSRCRRLSVSANGSSTIIMLVCRAFCLSPRGHLQDHPPGYFCESVGMRHMYAHGRSDSVWSTVFSAGTYHGSSLVLQCPNGISA